MKPVSLLLVFTVAAMAGCGGGAGSSGSGGSGGSGLGSLQWQQIRTPFSHVRTVAFAPNGHIFVADRTQGFYRSTDGGSTWSTINSGIATKFGWSINALSNGDLIAGIYSSGGPNLYPVHFYRSTNEGATWTMIQTGSLDTSPAWTGCVVAANSNLICGGFWAAVPSPGAWYSANGGTTFNSISTTSTNGYSVFALALNPVTNELWMGTEQYGIFRSTDNGATWSPASPPDTQIDSVHGIRDGNVLAITFDRNGNVLFGSQGGIWKSSQNGGGFNWTNVKGNSTTEDGVALARASNGALFYGHKMATSDPISVDCSSDNGNTWTPCGSGMAQLVNVYALAVNPSDGKLYATTWSDATSSGALYRTVSPVQ